MRYVLLTVAAVVCLRTSTRAQIPSDSWNSFVEGSYSKFHKTDEPLGFEDHLYQAAKAHGTQSDAVADFSTRIGVTSDIGATYAAVIVESVQRRSVGCTEPCDFLPGNAFYDRVSRLAAEPTGQLLIAIGKNLDRTSLWHDRGWLALALRHPAGQKVLQALFDYSEDLPMLVAMFAATDPSGWDPTSIVAAVDGQDDGPDGWDGWLDAFVEVAERRALESHAPLEVRAAVAQLGLRHALRMGLSAEAVRRYLGYPAEIRDQLPVAMRFKDQSCRIAEGYAFTDDLAAALWSTNHRAEARALLREEYASLGTRPRSSRDRFNALSDALTPSIPADDLFDRYLTRTASKEVDPCAWADRAGWLDAVMESPSIRPLAAARLRAAGYRDIAADLESGGPYRRDSERASELSHYARLFPDSVRAQRERWSKMIDAVWRTTSQGPGSQGPVRVTPPATRRAWPERPLPRGMQAWKQTDTPSVPPGLDLPVDAEAVVRYESVNAEHAIIYHSSDYEQPGEVPAYGIWFARTERGRWMRPIYLGLRQYFPYVVTPGSRLPLLAGNVLQLEVQVREIDPASIIFPPVATVLRRSADGRYLSIDLARASADRDRDGLTDIEEATLGLDAANPDSDGDGLRDGSDPLPLTAYRPDMPATDNALARAIVTRLIGDAADAIVVGPARADARGLETTTRTRANTVFLVGDPRIFAGISMAPFRILVYSDGDIRALNRGPAPFYPPTILHMFSSLDRRRHYVEWSARWAGGRFMVTCTASGGTCETADLSSWIT